RTELGARHGVLCKFNGGCEVEKAMEKQESEKPLSNFPTATTTTKYTQLWDTDSRGKSKPCFFLVFSLAIGLRVPRTLLSLRPAKPYSRITIHFPPQLLGHAELHA